MSLRSVALAVSASLLASLSCAATTTPANSADVVWRIGTFDASSAEFSGDTPSHPVVYQPGTSQPGDWPSFAPALFPHAKEDPATAPRTIQFNLDQPAPAWRLRVSLIIERSSVPALRVIVNRHSGTYYLHPRLDFSMGDNMDAFFPAYSQATVDVDLPGNALQPGVNTIALQAVATADAGVPDAGFNYDAIELDRLSALRAEKRFALGPGPQESVDDERESHLRDFACGLDRSVGDTLPGLGLDFGGRGLPPNDRVGTARRVSVRAAAS